MPTANACVACRSLRIPGVPLCTVHREADELERYVRDYVDASVVVDLPSVAAEFVRRGQGLLDRIDAVEG